MEVRFLESSAKVAFFVRIIKNRFNSFAYPLTYSYLRSPKMLTCYVYRL